MTDLNGDGIPDGAEVELKATWVKSPVRSENGTAYAGESRGGFTNVGRQAIENTMRGGGDDVDAALAGVRREREFQPVIMMDGGVRRQGSVNDVMTEMDRGRTAFDTTPMSRTGQTDMNTPGNMLFRNDTFENATNKAHRMMTGGMAGGQAPDRDERLENARRVMSDPSQSLARRQAAGVIAGGVMGEQSQEKQLATDERIQQIMSGGKVQEAQETAKGVMGAAEQGRMGMEAQAGAQAGATKFKAEQDRMGTEAQAGAVKHGADKSLEGQLAAVKATLEGVKYGADQETVRAREAARATLDGIRARMAGGAYQGEMVRNEAGYVGIWDDKAMDYKWEKPPSTEAPARYTQPGGAVIEMGGKGSNVNIDALTLWKANGRGGSGKQGVEPPAGETHGPAVFRKRNPDGTMSFRDEQGNIWTE